MMFLKTPKAAKALGVSYSQLIYLIRMERMAPPDMDSSGDYIWLPADLDRAREALTRVPKPGQHIPRSS
jgi:hypothetical protein